MNIRRIAALALLAGGVCAPAIANAGPMPVYNWSGAYAGAQVGYGWGTGTAGPVDLYDDPLDAPTATLPGFSLSSNGFVGGVEAGYNWQANGMVVGVEADISAANIHGTYTDEDNAFSVESNISWLSTARLRVGLPVDRVMIFGTGGIAVGGVTATLHDQYTAATFSPSNYNTSVGWTVGAGVAAAINDKWSLKAEYLYVDLGTENHSFEEDSPGWPLITTSAKTTANVVKFSLDHKF
jgi:outer membrane immunogenic protein